MPRKKKARSAPGATVPILVFLAYVVFVCAPKASANRVLALATIVTPAIIGIAKR